MSRREYPYIGADRLSKKGCCSLCMNPTMRRVDIQVSWFRGEDEVFNLCNQHYEYIGLMKANAAVFGELLAARDAELDKRRKQNEIARQRAAQRKSDQARAKWEKNNLSAQEPQ